jgi:hypothetical protein
MGNGSTHHSGARASVPAPALSAQPSGLSPPRRAETPAPQKVKKRWAAVLAFLLLVLPAWAQHGRHTPQGHFYNVDTERTVDGTIREVVFEQRYGERSRFLILVTEEKGTGKVFHVELGPSWYFKHELHKGENVEVIGSYYEEDEISHVIARRLQAGNKTFRLRDDRGFPEWRGGPGGRKGRGWSRGT